MSVSSILESTSYSNLNAAEKRAVLRLFDKGYLVGNKLSLSTPQIFSKRKSLSVSLDFYGSQLDTINPASFAFLHPRQRKVLEQELLYAFYIFSAQYQLDEAEHRRQNLPERSAQIKNCAYLMSELRRSSKKKTPESLLTKAINESEKHAKYLGLTVAPVIAGLMLNLDADTTKHAEEWRGASKTGVVKEWMGEVNGRRLYWVWGGNLLSTIISMLPDDFANKPQAQRGLAVPSPVTGYMSFILYYARFGINLALLLKHTLSGPWMSAEEAKIPWRERFKTQWAQRKFALLNDSIWGLANMACFLWLTGSGMLGYYGNVVTTALLLMDVTISIWRFWEESTQHNVDLARYVQDIKVLRAKINIEKDEEEKKILWLQLNALLKAKEQCEFNWRHKKYALTNDVVYAVGLMVAFALMCCFLFPPAAIAPATAIILGTIGSVLCFVFTSIYTAVSGGFEIAKSREASRVAKNECNELLQQFKIEKNELIRKQLYLEMKQLMAASDYQQQSANFQKMKLIRAMFIDAMIPPLIFVSLLFMPLGIGLAVMAAGFALAIITHLILKRFEPKAAVLPEFDEVEYTKFASKKDRSLADLSGEKTNKKQEHSGFFGKDKTLQSDKSQDISPDEPFNDDQVISI